VISQLAERLTAASLPKVVEALADSKDCFRHPLMLST
jgi:hypothetical protein